MSGRSLRSSPGSCSTVVRRTQRRSPVPVPEIPSNPDDYIESEEQDAAGEEALRRVHVFDAFQPMGEYGTAARRNHLK